VRATEWWGSRVPVEGLNDARTKLAEFFSILLRLSSLNRPLWRRLPPSTCQESP